MEITLGYGSYCKISSYQERLESSIETLNTTEFYPYEYFEHIHDNIDY